MKKIVVLLIVTFLLLGCGKQGSSVPTPTATPEVPPAHYLLMGVGWIEFHKDGDACRIDTTDSPFDKIIFILPTDCSLIVQPQSIHYYQFLNYGNWYNAILGEEIYLQVWGVDSEGVYKFIPPK